jgi:hypothetical protein
MLFQFQNLRCLAGTIRSLHRQKNSLHLSYLFLRIAIYTIPLLEGFYHRFFLYYMLYLVVFCEKSETEE